MGSDYSDLQCRSPVQDRWQARLVGFPAPGSINKRRYSIYGIHQPGKELWQGGRLRCRTRTAYLHLFPDLGIREFPVPGEFVGRDLARVTALRDCGTSVHERAFALDQGAYFAASLADAPVWEVGALGRPASRPKSGPGAGGCCPASTVVATPLTRSMWCSILRIFVP